MNEKKQAPLFISSENLAQFTGRIVELRYDFIYGYEFGTAVIEYQTKFQKTNGGYETQKNLIELSIWQRHNRVNIHYLSQGDIVRVTGQLKNNDYPRFLPEEPMSVFVCQLLPVKTREHAVSPDGLSIQLQADQPK